MGSWLRREERPSIVSSFERGLWKMGVMNYVWVWIAIMGLGSSVVAGEKVDVEVKAGQETLATSVKLKQGDCVQIVANGSIKMGALTGWNGPEGSSAGWILKRWSDYPAGALIGSVKSESGRETFFLIGKDSGLEAPFDGRLILYVNEKILADNEGSFQVRIERQTLKSLRNRIERFF